MYRIEVLKPCVIEGREYQPGSGGFPTATLVALANGRPKQFKTMGNAVRYCTEIFGSEYRTVLRIFSA
jgi:hypothetical protein